MVVVIQEKDKKKIAKKLQKKSESEVNKGYPEVGVVDGHVTGGEVEYLIMRSNKVSWYV